LREARIWLQDREITEETLSQRVQKAEDAQRQAVLEEIARDKLRSHAELLKLGISERSIGRAVKVLSGQDEIIVLNPESDHPLYRMRDRAALERMMRTLLEVRQRVDENPEQPVHVSMLIDLLRYALARSLEAEDYRPADALLFDLRTRLEAASTPAARGSSPVASATPAPVSFTLEGEVFKEATAAHLIRSVTNRVLGDPRFIAATDWFAGRGRSRYFFNRSGIHAKATGHGTMRRPAWRSSAVRWG
jgi:hypothetical protein